MSFGKIHIFSVTLLHPFKGDSISEHQECHPPPPPLIVCNGIEEYKVEKILDSWIFHGKVEYKYAGRAMVLKKTNGALSVMCRAPSNSSPNSTAPTHRLLIFSQHRALGCCTFEGGVMSWFVP